MGLPLNEQVVDTTQCRKVSKVISDQVREVSSCQQKYKTFCSKLSFSVFSHQGTRQKMIVTLPSMRLYCSKNSQYFFWPSSPNISIPWV